MSMSRKDSKGRVLRKGESQRKNDGRYIYQYTDSTGKRRVVYSNDLLELREKEKELVRNQLDGLESYCSGKTTLNYAFDRYISTKYDLKEHTRVNYKYMYNRFVRDTFGKRIINDIKYSDVKFFYCSLMNILGLQANTLDNIHMKLTHAPASMVNIIPIFIYPIIKFILSILESTEKEKSRLISKLRRE